MKRDLVVIVILDSLITLAFASGAAAIGSWPVVDFLIYWLALFVLSLVITGITMRFYR